MGPPGRCSREFGMKWRVILELVGPDGVVGVHEIGGRAAVAEYAPRMIGLTLEEGKQLLAGLQVHLVQAQAEDHSRHRRRCQRCGAQRPLKDQRSRRLMSLFGTVTVRAPRFTPCRCAVTCRRTLNPVAEIMPDRCTPEYERTVAKMGSLLPYRRARTLLAEFLPLGKPQAVETTRQRTLRVGTRLEQEAVAGAGSKSAVVATKSIALSIDGGHVRAARQYQGRTFEVLLAQVNNDEGKQVVFASVPAEATSQTRQLRGVLHGLGATPATPVTILSDGADGPRSLGEAASPGPTHHVLDCWGGRPHGIECQTWVVTNQDRSRPCPRLPALVLIRPRLSSPCTASTMLAGLYCEPISAARRWSPSLKSFPPPKSPWKRAGVPTTGLGNSAPSVTTSA
jgi:hypothetical protein